MWVCPCSRGLFWLYEPPSSSSCGGKAGAFGSFEAGEGFASPAAGPDGSQNTNLEEKHLLDGLERVITNLWVSPSFRLLKETVRGWELGQKKRGLQFLFGLALCWLVRLLFCVPWQPVCRGGDSGFRSTSRLSCVGLEARTQGVSDWAVCFSFTVFVLPGEYQEKEGNALGVGKLLVEHLRGRFTDWAAVSGADRSGCCISIKLWKYWRDFKGAAKELLDLEKGLYSVPPWLIFGISCSTGALQIDLESFVLIEIQCN